MQNFWQVAANGSQLQLLPRSRHLQFCDGGPNWNRILTLLDHCPEWFTKPTWIGTRLAREPAPANINLAIEALLNSDDMDTIIKGILHQHGQQADVLVSRSYKVKKVCSAAAAAMLAYMRHAFSA